MQNLEFNRNDNGKLFQEIFSCVRQYNEDLYEPGNVLNILYKGESLGTAEVLAVKTIRFQDLNDTLSYIDCGNPVQYMAASIRRQVPDVDNYTALHHVVLQYKTRNLEMQGTLLMSWWTDVYAIHAQAEPNKTVTHE